MLTNEGKTHIKRYLANYVPTIAQSIAFGVGTGAESVNDESLEFETGRAPILLTTYDFVTDSLIYKASIPEEYIGEIREVAIFSLTDDPSSGEYGSRLVSGFDSATEGWVDPSTEIASPFGSTATRIGEDSLLHTPAASTTTTSALRDIFLDFIGNSSADKFIFALNVANANTNSIELRFMTDTSNYYSISITTPVQSAGYKILELAKGTATPTGSPDWSNISEIRILTTSKSSGASSVEFDGLRIQDVDTINIDYIMVSREVLATPHIKLPGMAQDIEFSIEVTL